ncbi:hypothetical protein CK203_082638 [Vitis vinifera]|uniref:Uncharacterized protein n=1 Tax=Vitis vinifera TaxID=29760 RepID=A0A438BWS2_VITVI|nr:hypothetical protein CK203_082638 [Vitis vinifera]
MSENLPRMDVIIRRPWKTIDLQKRRESEECDAGKKGPGVAIEGSTLVTTGGGYNKVATFQRKSDERPRVWCDFATNLAILVRRWKIHGKLANWKGKTGDKPGRAIIPTANEAETSLHH